MNWTEQKRDRDNNFIEQNVQYISRAAKREWERIYQVNGIKKEKWKQLQTKQKCR